MISDFAYSVRAASSETPPPSILQGVWIVPLDNLVSVEEVLLAAGEQVGHKKHLFASRMNKVHRVFKRRVPHLLPD